MPTAELPHEIVGLILPFDVRWLWVASILALLVVSAIYLLRRYFKNRKKSASQQLTIEDPVEACIKRLNALVPNLEKLANPKEYYFHLTTEMKLLIELTLIIPATDLTTNELRNILQKRWPLVDDDRQRLLEVLYRADQVKFAEQLSRLEEASEHHRFFCQLARKLRPVDRSSTSELALSGVKSGLEQP